MSTSTLPARFGAPAWRSASSATSPLVQLRTTAPKAAASAKVPAEAHPLPLGGGILLPRAAHGGGEPARHPLGQGVAAVGGGVELERRLEGDDDEQQQERAVGGHHRDHAEDDPEMEHEDAALAG